MWQGLGKAWSLRGGQLGLRGETGCLHSLIIIIIDQMSTARKGKGHTQTEWHHLKTVLFSGCLHQHASSSCAAELCATPATLRLQRQPERPPNTEQTQGMRQGSGKARALRGGQLGLRRKLATPASSFLITHQESDSRNDRCVMQTDWQH